MATKTKIIRASVGGTDATVKSSGKITKGSTVGMKDVSSRVGMKDVSSKGIKKINIRGTTIKK